MSGQRYRVQTWIRRNQVALSELGEPQNDLAGLFVRAGVEAVLQEPDLGVWDEREMSPEDSAAVRAAGRRLGATARRLGDLRPVPDDTAQALLEAALRAYVEVGDALSSDDFDWRKVQRDWKSAGAAYDEFANRLVEVRGGGATRG